MFKSSKINTIICVSLLVFGMLNAVFIFETDDVEGATISVPGDYPTIQSAVENATEGDTISVAAGQYNEDIEIRKTLNIVGAGNLNTVINGTGTTHVIRVYDNNVNITGFNITNAGSYGAGVYVYGRNCNISNNILYGNYYGVYVSWEENTVISNNDITGGYYGIRVYGDDNVIRGNTIHDNSYYGIYGAYSDDGLVTRNHIHSERRGLYLYDCIGWDIKENNFSDNYQGISVRQSEDLNLENCEFYSNSYGAWLEQADDTIFKNCSFNDSSNYAIHGYSRSMFKVFNSSIQGRVRVDRTSEGWLVNSTFSEMNLQVFDDASLHIRWFLDIRVEDTGGQPVSDCIVTVQDSDGTLISTGKTDGDGMFEWIVVPEYILYSGDKVNKTPTNLLAAKGSLANISTVIVNETKNVTLVLDSPRPEVDYLLIEDEKGEGGIHGRRFLMYDEYELYASGYNSSLGYIHPVEAQWTSNDSAVADVIPGPDTNTTMDTGERGECKITISNSTLGLSHHSNITIFAPVYNLDQDIYYNEIQPAVNEANENDTILVSNWTFHIDSTIDIYNSVNLIGSGWEGTVIDGEDTNSQVFYVRSDWVSITNFTIKNSAQYSGGIILYYDVHNCSIYRKDNKQWIRHSDIPTD